MYSVHAAYKFGSRFHVLPKGMPCDSCYFENGSSTAIAIACMKRDCAKMAKVAVPMVVGGDEESNVPMRLRPAIAEILKIHNSPNTIKPQDMYAKYAAVCTPQFADE